MLVGTILGREVLLIDFIFFFVIVFLITAMNMDYFYNREKSNKVITFLNPKER